MLFVLRDGIGVDIELIDVRYRCQAIMYGMSTCCSTPAVLVGFYQCCDLEEKEKRWTLKRFGKVHQCH